MVERSEFCGKDFSFGDKFIAEKARNGTKPGNPKQWLLAGINHHIALTAKMIQSSSIPTTRESTEVPIATSVVEASKTS